MLEKGLQEGMGGIAGCKCKERVKRVRSDERGTSIVERDERKQGDDDWMDDWMDSAMMTEDCRMDD